MLKWAAVDFYYYLKIQKLTFKKYTFKKIKYFHPWFGIIFFTVFSADELIYLSSLLVDRKVQHYKENTTNHDRKVNVISN